MRSAGSGMWGLCEGQLWCTHQNESENRRESHMPHSKSDWVGKAIYCQDPLVIDYDSSREANPHGNIDCVQSDLQKKIQSSEERPANLCRAGGKFHLQNLLAKYHILKHFCGLCRCDTMSSESQSPMLRLLPYASNHSGSWSPGYYTAQAELGLARCYTLIMPCWPAKLTL